MTQIERFADVAPLAYTHVDYHLPKQAPGFSEVQQQWITWTNYFVEDYAMRRHNGDINEEIVSEILLAPREPNDLHWLTRSVILQVLHHANLPTYLSQKEASAVAHLCVSTNMHACEYWLGERIFFQESNTTPTEHKLFLAIQKELNNVKK